MNVEKTSKHIASNFEIYKFVGGTKAYSPEAIKEHLMKECGKAESTARNAITSIKDNENSLFSIEWDTGRYFLEEEKILEFEEALENIFKWNQFDWRNDQFEQLWSKKNKALDRIAELEDELEAREKAWERERKKYQKKIAILR